MNKPNDLEDRLIDFAVDVINVVEVLPNSKAGNHIANQLVRSGTSPAPNYGEARGAESKKEFCDPAKTEAAIQECEELIAIFVSGTKTAEGNQQASS